MFSNRGTDGNNNGSLCGTLERRKRNNLLVSYAGFYYKEEG